MQTKKMHWPSLLILITLGLGIAVELLIMFGMGVSSLIDLFGDSANPAGEMIVSVAFGFEALVLLACAWFVLQKTLGWEKADAPFKFPFSGWQVIALLAVVLLAAAIGGVSAYSEIAWLNWIVLPFLTLLVIIPPVWILFGIGSNGIELGPRWRVFSVLGLGMTLGPVIMIFLELFLLLIILVIGWMILAVQNPDLFQEITRLSQMLSGDSNPDVILKLTAPYITSPLVITIILGYIAVLVPMIEELLKPLAVWIFATRLDSPAQGFAMGVLSGGAFALLESLNASGDGSTGWPVIVTVRAGTSLLHMTATGLVGWGIASAFREKKVARFFGAYFSAVLIHGLWNACAVGAGISTVGELMGKSGWLFSVIPAALCGMTVLGVGMLVVLIASNQKLRKAVAEKIEPVIEEKIIEGVQ